MSKLKLSIIILVSILFGAGIILAGFWFLSGKLFSAWTDKIVAVNQKSVVQSAPVQPVDCSLPTSADMVIRDNYEKIKQASRKCADYAEAKLQYNFDPNNNFTWDNAFPSREDWALRRDLFKAALNGPWSTYTNKEHNFEFEYPQGWKVLVSTDGSQISINIPGTQVVSPLIINVQDSFPSSSDYANSANLWLQSRTEVHRLTKEMVDEKRMRIEDSSRASDKYGKFVTLGNDYASYGHHTFFRHAEFFIDKNYFIVTQPLSVVVLDVAGWLGVQEDALAKVNDGSINEVARLEIKFIDQVVNSFRPVSLKSIK